MKKFGKSAALILMALLLCTAVAFAAAVSSDNDEWEVDPAGNALASGSGASGKTVELDLYAAGESVSVNNSRIRESAILAGRDVSVSGGSIGGSLRAAGYNVSVAGTQIDANITAAGYNISMGAGSVCRAVYATGATVSFGGKCETLSAAAQKVTISGEINSDAYISAQSVEIASGAVINGTLHVSAPEEPQVASGVKIGKLDYTPTAAQSASSPIVDGLKGLIMLLPGRILIAVLFYFVLRRTTRDAADMIKSRPVYMPATGLVSMVAIPVAVILLMITYIGIPVGVLVLCLFVLALVFATSFAGCAAGQCLLPKLHPLVASIIGVAALSVLKIVPYLGALVTVACMVYTLGYFIQRIYLNLPKSSRPAPEMIVPAAPQELPADDGTAQL